MFHDPKSNNYNYKNTFSSEICSICREDLIYLPPKVALRWDPTLLISHILFLHLSSISHHAHIHTHCSATHFITVPTSLFLMPTRSFFSPLTSSSTIHSPFTYPIYSHVYAVHAHDPLSSFPSLLIKFISPPFLTFTPTDSHHHLHPPLFIPISLTTTHF